MAIDNDQIANKLREELTKLADGLEFYVYADFSGEGISEKGLEAGTLKVHKAQTYAEATCAAAYAYSQGAKAVKAVIDFPNPAGFYNAMRDALTAGMIAAAEKPAERQSTPGGDSVISFTDKRKLH